MTIAAKKEKLHEYVNTAEDNQIDALLSFVESPETKYNHLTEDGFWDEMDKRVDELKSGKVKGISWEEFERNAKKITG